MLRIYDGSIFHLETENTSYVLHILPSGHAEHLYYGRKLRSPEKHLTALREKRYTRPQMGTYADDEDENLVLSDTLLEFSTEGKGDYRTPLLAISSGDKGERTADFRYSGFMKHDGIDSLSGLPQAKDSNSLAETLILVFDDERRGLSLTLTYTVFPKLDAIIRRSTIKVKGKDGCIVRSLLSAQLDFRSRGMKLTSFSGSWGREFEKHESIIEGTRIIESRMMASSAEANPGFIVENECGAYALNLIYSGPHRATLTETPYGMTHIVWGMNPDTLSWPLESGESFDSPEAVMIFAPNRKKLSEKMHRFINACIIRSVWSGRMRPLMLSTEHALSYSLTESGVLSLAKHAKNIGMEGILLADGWFGARRNDKTSIGDWFANTMRFPSGLFELSQEIHKQGLLFGLWFEPEGISGKSLLYKEHPDWIIGRSDKENAKGRYENLLDLTREDVRAWIVDTLSDIVERCRVDYIRWDMNRHVSDIFSYRDIREYGMFMHKYIQGLYRVLGTIGRKFPSLYIETSAGGGARFDLGMLCYSASITLSNNSDPIHQAAMIASAAELYPLSVISTEITPSPNWMTHRIVDRETRFNAAAFSVLSYSVDISSMTQLELVSIKQQVEFYKKYRMLFQFGRFHLQECGNRIVFSVSDADSSTMLLLYLQKLVQPNTTAEKLYAEDANPELEYNLLARPHMMSEQEISSYPQETECYSVSGDILRWAGIPLAEQVSGNDYHEGMRMLGDFSSRLYIIRRSDRKN